MLAPDGGVYDLGGGEGVFALDGLPSIHDRGCVFVLGIVNLFALNGHVFALGKGGVSDCDRCGVTALGGGGVFPLGGGGGVSVLAGGMVVFGGAGERPADDLTFFGCVPRRYMLMGKDSLELVARPESLTLLEREPLDSLEVIEARTRSVIMRANQVLKYFMISHNQSRFC